MRQIMRWSVSGSQSLARCPHNFALSVVLVLLLPLVVLATNFTGRVVGVIDGDTIEVLNGHPVERIRLSRIDCLEPTQAC